MNAGGARRRPRKIGRWILLVLVLGAVGRSLYARRRAAAPAAPAVAPPAAAPDSLPRGDSARVLFDSKKADSATIKPTPTPIDAHPVEVIVRVVPEGVRVKVEVLNGTDVSGLARRGMFAMRDAGFDVVSFGSTKDRSDTTIVIDRTGHPDWAALAAKTLSGPVRVRSEPDDSRYVDLSILLGSHWTPPRQPFHP
jgi:hypothetical protein